MENNLPMNLENAWKQIGTLYMPCEKYRFQFDILIKIYQKHMKICHFVQENRHSVRILTTLKFSITKTLLKLGAYIFIIRYKAWLTVILVSSINLCCKLAMHIGFAFILASQVKNLSNFWTNISDSVNLRSVRMSMAKVQDLYKIMHQG